MTRGCTNGYQIVDSSLHTLARVFVVIGVKLSLINVVDVSNPIQVYLLFKPEVHYSPSSECPCLGTNGPRFVQIILLVICLNRKASEFSIFISLVLTSLSSPFSVHFDFSYKSELARCEINLVWFYACSVDVMHAHICALNVHSVSKANNV